MELAHGSEIAEDAIDSAEGGFQVQISLVALGAHGGVPTRDELEHCPIRFIAGALLLDCEVKEGPGTKANLPYTVLECFYHSPGCPAVIPASRQPWR